MADEYIKIRELTEASLTDVSNDSIVEASVENAQAASGFVTRKIKLSTLASYVLNKFSTLSLGGTTRTVKSAIDSIVSTIGNLTNLSTTDKTSLVAAINEAASELSATGITYGYVPTADGDGEWNWAPQSGGGGSGTVDSALSNSSENPVQNKVITNALAAKANAASVPTKTSDLTNDSGFITDAGVTSFNGSTGAVNYTAPVTSVNGSTGAVTGLQITSNLVTSVSSSSTNIQYPSAKLFYDTVGNIESLLAAI